MNKLDVLDEIADLKLPVGEYVVVGGAAMAVRDIRETQDIDLVVTLRLFKELERAGWHFKARPNGKPGLRRGCVEAYLDVNCGSFERSTEWLVEHAQSVEGVPLVDLDTLASFKENYGRPKDLRDLQLIRDHMTSQSQVGGGSA